MSSDAPLRHRWKLSHYVATTDPIFDESDHITKRVVFATKTARVRAIDELTWQNLAAGRFQELPAAFFHDYKEIGLIVPEEQNELQFLLEENNAAAVESDDLYVVIQPTAMCQLGCDYCGQHHSARQLSEDDRQ